MQSRLFDRIIHGLRGAAAVVLLAISAAGSACAWQTAHGQPDNSGTIDVLSAAAVNPLTSIRGLGGIAPGVVPVIAPNGTLYIGNARGKLMSFRPDGTPGWSRDVGLQGIMSAPALGSDGSIYVVGSATVRDRTTTPTTVKHIAELHKFSSSGAWLWHVPLPGAENGSTLNASPNILRLVGADVVLVPAMQSSSGTFNARLTAFSADAGGVLADKIVTSFAPQATGGSGGLESVILAFGNYICDNILGGRACTFTSTEPFDPEPNSRLPKNLRTPFPAVAIHAPAGGGAPIVMMSGGFQTLVGLSFTGNAFEERFRVRDGNRFFLSTPLVRRNGHVMISTGGYNLPPQILFAGLDLPTLSTEGPVSFAVPTALGNDRFAIVHRTGGVTIMKGAVLEKFVELPGESIASAAASSNQLFVSTASALHTFDKTTLQSLGTFAWTGGGTSQPVIGPQGNVYAIAGDTLFVFQSLFISPAGGSGNGPVLGGGVYQDGNAPTPPKPQSVSYKPPLSKNGNRLFACLELDGDDCGKKDHREIAKQYCVKEGYTQPQEFDVETRKVKAETLAGDEYCSKKKCKVFEQIVCANN